MDCIFCKILSGNIPCKKIYEDESVLAFLDITPHTAGHTLIIPKEHHTDILDMDSELLCHIGEVSKIIFNMYKEKLDIVGMTLVQNNGYGQEVKHYHLHLVPRYKKDGLFFCHKKVTEEIDEVYKKITA